MGGLIERIAPRYALKRQLARMQLERLYKAAAPSNARSTPRDWRSGDGVMDQARAKLRQWGRHLDENHDLTHSILNQLSYQASQIEIEPRVLTRRGDAAVAINEQIKALWLKHRDQLDAAGQMPWCVLASTVARTWFRDGEVFAQHMMGTAAAYPTELRYMIEAHEPDFVPYEMNSDAPRIVHGIELNSLGRAVAYHLYRTHPGDSVSAFASMQTLRIPADQITHLKLTKRLGQKRGASVLAPAVGRLADINDYEESERLAAKIASSLCAAITRGADFVNTTTAIDPQSGERPMELQPGVIFDNLAPGERVEVLDTNRPNTGLSDFRKAMLRAATAGIGVSYSSATHDYDGTYSSQRQELVEARAGYDYMRAHFVSGFLRPVWSRFMQAVQVGDLVSLAGADPKTLANFEAIAPPAPWIDPQKEARADEIAINAGIESRHGVIRRRGGDPKRVDDERDEPRQANEQQDDPVVDLELVSNEG